MWVLEEIFWTEGNHFDLVTILSMDWKRHGSTAGGMGGSLGHSLVRKFLMLAAVIMLRSSCCGRA